MAKQKVKAPVDRPNPGDLMVEVYNDNKELQYVRFFKTEKAEWRFLKSLPCDQLAKAYRYIGWQLMQYQGDWWKDID